MRVLMGVVVLWLGCVVQPVVAEPLPGADDPALRAAALAWLAEDDAEGALWTIGELAVDGNIAARYFLQRVYYSPISGERRLSRTEFLERLPEDTHPYAGGLIPFAFDRSRFPVFVALQQLLTATSAEEWIASAQIVIDAGMTSHLGSSVDRIFKVSEHIDIEVAEFVQEHLADDPYLYAPLTQYLATQYVLSEAFANADPQAAADRDSRWSSEPWPQERSSAFVRSLYAREWLSLHIEGYLRRWPLYFGVEKRLVDPSLLNDEQRRLADIVSLGGFGTSTDVPAPTQSELEVLADSYSRHALRFTSARTNLTLCERYCPDSFSECAVQTGIVGDLRFLKVAFFSPVISRSEFFESERAVRAQLAVLGLIEYPVENRPEWVVLPQCLMGPARHAAAEMR